MMVVGGKDVRVTIGGVEVPVKEVTYELRPPAAGRAPLSFSRGFELSCETNLDEQAFGRFLYALSPPASAATVATLARRVLYGGRKGRRALRRLRAMGYVLVRASYP